MPLSVLSVPFLPKQKYLGANIAERFEILILGHVKYLRTTHIYDHHHHQNSDGQKFDTSQSHICNFKAKPGIRIASKKYMSNSWFYEKNLIYQYGMEKSFRFILVLKYRLLIIFTGSRGTLYIQSENPISHTYILIVSHTHSAMVK